MSAELMGPNDGPEPQAKGGRTHSGYACACYGADCEACRCRRFIGNPLPATPTIAAWDTRAAQPTVKESLTAQPVRRLYLAGPMSGLPAMNYPAFHVAAMDLRARGFHVENPAENPSQASWQAYMRLSCAQMLTCDSVAMLPGWQTSRGARIEFDLARGLELECRPVEFYLQQEGA